MLLCEFTIEHINRWSLPSWPVTFGVPFAPGVLADESSVFLEDGAETILPTQTRVLARHEDGSVRRLLVDAEPSLAGQERTPFRLVAQTRPRASLISWDGRRSVGAEVKVRRDGDAVILERAGQSWKLAFHGRVETSGRTSEGVVHLDEVRVTESGPVRLRLDLSGRLLDGAAHVLDVDVVLQTFSRTPACFLDVTFMNRTDEPVVQLHCFSMTMTRLAGQYDEQVEVEVRNGPSGQRLRLPGSVHTDRLVTTLHEGEREVQRRAGRLLGYGETWMSVAEHEGALTMGLRNFWECYPYGVELDRDSISVDFFPPWAAAAELPMGVGKTHEVMLALTHGEERDTYPSRALGYAFGKPPLVQIPLEHRRAAGTLAEYLPYLPDSYPRMETNLFDLFQNRIRGFGKFNWGDDYSPLYTNQRRGGGDVVWNNLEGDHPYHAFCQFARTGQFIYWKDLHDSIFHWMDVDFADKHPNPKHQGALITHTRRHVVGGGSGPNHNWAEGFKEWYYLTGDPRALHALNQMADWLLRRVEEDYRIPPYVRNWGWGLIQMAAIYDVTGREDLYPLMGRLIGQLHAYFIEHDGLVQRFGETPGTDSVNAFHSATVAIGAYHYHRLSGDETAKTLCVEVARSISDARGASPEGIPTYVNGPEQNFPMQQAATLTLGALALAWELTGDETLVRRGMRMLEYCLDRGMQVDHMRIPGQFVEFDDGICLMPELVWPNCQLLGYQLRGVLLFMKAAHACGYLKEVDYRF